MSLRTISECLHVFGNASTATIAVLAATPQRRVAVFRLIITTPTAVTVTLQDTTGAALTQAFALAAGGQLVLETQPNWDPWIYTNIGVGLQIAQSGTVNIGFDAWYILGP